MRAILVLVLGLCVCQGKYSPDWNSLDSRPLPSWYDDAKIGVFMHWGPYSVPGVSSEWFWSLWKRNDSKIESFMEEFYPPGFTYQEFGPAFRAEFFNATQWAHIVASSGAKYYVLTSKHHDGFANWPSSRNFGWNSKDNGPKRDVVGELAEAFRTLGQVKFGLYHSLFEWFNPMWLQDKANNFTSVNFVEGKIYPELLELVNTYQPEVLWSDGEWEAPDTYWRSKEFLAWLYNESPVKDTIVVNDRWGHETLCKHGGFYTCTDRYNPGVLQKHKWENAMTIDRYSWGNRRNINIEDILSMEELVGTLASTISCGGNLLMNVGPTSQGTIEPIFQLRLKEMGDWLAVNGEGVYGSRPWTVQNDTLNGQVWYTQKVDPKVGTLVYAFLLQWPADNKVVLGSTEACKDTTATMLGYNRPLDWKRHEGGGLELDLPEESRLASQWAWVIRFDDLANAGNQIW